jgi:hypothetical protein
VQRLGAELQKVIRAQSTIALLKSTGLEEMFSPLRRKWEEESSEDGHQNQKQGLLHVQRLGQRALDGPQPKSEQSGGQHKEMDPSTCQRTTAETHLFVS